ncbi:3-beta hydroxysteroid dehydrogenase [Geotalea uraniireducens]|uniref:3-beta hydroxysteroid dehydrogenase n=1 Tax=Geotalea uraniireducens TaxID=351604 RepID=A0ABM8EIB6_9BACT|nr:NAD-dependent epimerase/dehydratase family protein [Geotalea uraniireducens]BDV42211.1 3-beta hydroxysteroid dehydrogenase [Geotalea uraniireducens]
MKALVTGGGGFLGGAVVRQLVARGDTVRSFSRGDYPELARLGVEQCRGDLADREALFRAAAGCDIVFHVAAKAGVWGAEGAYYAANVTGTANVIAACRAHGIGRLVYTGSPSVVFDGRDVAGGDESLPYPRRFTAPYPRTKALAEQLVLAANAPSLATVSLRPHLIWGPGDNHLVPRIIAKARAGRLRRIGSRPCPVDTVYIDNAAQAHLLAADRLAPGAPLAGRAYFISNGEPLPLWEMIDRILAAAGLPPVRRRIPAGVAYAAGALCEGLWHLFRRADEPPLTRFVAKELATAHWFDIGAARRDLGFAPTVSIDEGLRRLREWLAGTAP